MHLPGLAASEGTEGLGEGCSPVSAGVGLGGLWLDGSPGAGAVTLLGFLRRLGSRCQAGSDGGRGKTWFLSASEGGLSGAFLVS